MGNRRLIVAVIGLVGFARVAFSQNPPGASSDPAPGQPRQLANQQNNFPWNRDLMMRWSTDGTSFGDATVFVESAGVPSLTSDDKGRIFAAFQWFPFERTDAFDKVAVKMSETGGSSWSDPAPIVVENLPGEFQRPFDPTLVALPDGKFRMYFSCGARGKPGPSSRSDAIGTYSAISDDGIHYKFENGARFEVAGSRVIDCGVVSYKGVWQYVAPIGKPEDGAYYATSTDGLVFTRGANLASTNGMNWTGNLIALKDQVRFYGSSQRGIWYAASPDGKTWGAPAWTSIRGGDPAIVQAAGKYLLVYVGEPTRNLPPPAQMRKPAVPPTR